MASKGLGPLPRSRGSALAHGCGRSGIGALPLPRAAVITTGLRVRVLEHRRREAVDVRHRVGGPPAVGELLLEALLVLDEGRQVELVRCAQSTERGAEHGERGRRSLTTSHTADAAERCSRPTPRRRAFGDRIGEALPADGARGDTRSATTAHIG